MTELDLKRLGEDFRRFRITNEISLNFLKQEFGIHRWSVHQMEKGRAVQGKTLLLLIYYADLKVEDYLLEDGVQQFKMSFRYIPTSETK